MPEASRRPSLKLAALSMAAIIVIGALISLPISPHSLVKAQDAGPSGAVEPESNAPSAGEPTPDVQPKKEADGINLFSLALDGGFWMLPILTLSLVVVVFTIERFLALRRKRVIPDELIAGLTDLGAKSGGFDPRQAYRLCQQYPSAASAVIRSMLLKVGRPHSEVEHTVKETSEREADKLYANVRWLLLAAAVAPLFGLLGTVWGMIQAFHDTTTLEAGQNKADFLAEGIYIALVTTLGGLIVGISGAITSHWFEGRIQTLFREVDELLFNLLPQVERYEGRVRFSKQSAEGEAMPPEVADDSAKPAGATIKPGR